MAQGVGDRAYTNLLNHLQRPSPRLPLQTVLSAVPYYLSSLPLPHPAQLAAFVVSSSVWHPLSAESVWALANACRSAVHFKKGNLDREVRGWLARSPAALLDEWVRAVADGVDRGEPRLRAAILGGLLLGLEDVKRNHHRGGGGARETVEVQLVAACAQALETLSAADDAWRDEFKPGVGTGRRKMDDDVFLYVACQVLPHVASGRLRALDVGAFVQLLRKSLQSLFLDGAFLAELPSATARDGNELVSISPTLVTSLRNVSDNPLYKSAGPLAKLLARSLSLLSEIELAEAWHACHDTCQELELMSRRVAADWQSSLLATATSDEYIGTESRETATEVWSILKTFLFCNVLVSQSILSDVLYMRPVKASSPEIGPSSIARSVLSSLCYLSFTFSRFGGITSVGEGFKELKRVFYTALDIIAAEKDPDAGNSVVENLISSRDHQIDLNHPFRLSRTAYVLAVIEQLVPVLSDEVLERRVVPFCDPHLNDAQNRETYEAAHSVMLSIFADGAQRAEELPRKHKRALTQKLLPFYLNTLIENSGEGRLNRAQLKLAYSSLVWYATSSGDDALTWLCVDALLSRIKEEKEESGSPSSSARSMDLYVTLVSLISCVPLSLLRQELQEVEKALAAVDSEEDRKLLADAVMEEVTNRVGDQEREVALRWWCDVAPRFVPQEQEMNNH